MPVPIVFRQGADVSATFDWVDFISGCGYKTFYGACSIAGTYFLTPRATLASSTGHTVAAGGVFTEKNLGDDHNMNFDITFQKSAIIGGGDAYVNLTLEIDGASGANATVTATIYHYDGITETSIGTTTDITLAPTTDVYIRQLIKIPVTKKAFAIGDILRLNILSVNTTATVEIYHDPLSALTFTAAVKPRTIGSDLTFDCPFKITL